MLFFAKKTEFVKKYKKIFGFSKKKSYLCTLKRGSMLKNTLLNLNVGVI